MRISNGCVVHLNYRLTDLQGQLLDSSVEKAQLVYLHGSNNIVAGLEQALTGKQEGDRFAVDIPQAYGPRHDQLVQNFPLSAIEGVDNPRVGSVLNVKTRSGEIQRLYITHISADSVTIDANHPLAGLDLHFEGVIDLVRRATEHEIAEGCAVTPRMQQA
jgi:FKBP-type peptidyl-prolyl cis-trans isomerase SlyD